MKIKVVEPSIELLTDIEGMEQHIERCGRVCYKSEDRITDSSAERFVSKICRNRHESVLEHGFATVIVVCSRACSHQLVRHRLASYSQESQRYVNYSKKGYEVICPPSIGVPPGVYDDWKDLSPIQSEWLSAMFIAYDIYSSLLETLPPEDARFILPNACKTELAVTMNMRQWRHVILERALNKHAQWEIRGLMTTLYETFKESLPSVFGDLD